MKCRDFTSQLDYDTLEQAITNAKNRPRMKPALAVPNVRASDLLLVYQGAFKNWALFGLLVVYER